MIWPTAKEETDPKCTVPTVKHGDVLGLYVIGWTLEN